MITAGHKDKTQSLSRQFLFKMGYTTIILYVVACFVYLPTTYGEDCNDLDSEVCKMLEKINKDMCTDSCLSSICKRHCNQCPLKCYQCHEITDPANCTSLVDCPSYDHYCFTTQTFTDDFHEVYNMGCAMKDLCEQNIHNGKRSNINVKGACCTADKCNDILPDQIDLLPQRTAVTVVNTTVSPSGYTVCENLDDDICLRLSLSKPSFCMNDCIASNICPRMCRKCFQCYDCNDLDRPDLCNNTSTCQDGKECFQLETLSVDLRPVYRLGCLDESLCQRFGAPVQTGFGRRQQGIALKGGCCKTDLCNKVLHKEVTTPLPTTTTTILPTTTQIDCHNYKHHNHACPTGYIYEQRTNDCYKIGTHSLTWAESKKYCEDHCGYLADFNNAREMEYVLLHIIGTRSSRILWVDAVKDQHNRWIWSHNNNHIYSDISRYISGSNYPCAAIYSYHSLQARLHTESCSTHLYPLCKID